MLRDRRLARGSSGASRQSESDMRQLSPETITAIGLRTTELQDERNALAEALQNLQQLLVERETR